MEKTNNYLKRTINDFPNHGLIPYLKKENLYVNVEGELTDIFPYKKLLTTADYFLDKYVGMKDKDELESTSIGVIYDTDVDGLFSGHVIEDMLKRIGVTTYNYINPNKIHGLTNQGIEWCVSNNISCLFIVDGGSGDSENILKLSKLGIDVIVLDHHPYDNWLQDIDNNLASLIHIVNVADDVSVPQLSGCGVVYRFCEHLGKKLYMDTDKYLRYVGLTVISDICSLLVAENRFYVEYLYTYYEKHGKKDWLYKQFKFYGSKKGFFGWTVAPFFNALIRIGKEKQAVELVNSMNIMYKMNAIKRRVTSVKERQKELLVSLEEQGKIIETSHTVVHLRKDNLPIDTDISPTEATYYSTLNGLLANKLLDKYKKNAMVLFFNDTTKEWKGSFRGVTYTKNELMEYGIRTGGHDLACGVWGTPMDFKNFLTQFSLDSYYSKSISTKKNTLAPINFYINSMLTNNHNHKLLEIAMYNEFALTGSGIPPIQVVLRINDFISEKEILADHPLRRSYKYKEFVYVEFGDKNQFSDKESYSVFDVVVTNHAPYYELIRKHTPLNFTD